MIIIVVMHAHLNNELGIMQSAVYITYKFGPIKYAGFPFQMMAA